MFCFGSGSKREQWTKTDNRQIPNQVSLVPPPSPVSNEEAKCVGRDFCCWSLIYFLRHLPFLEPLKALSLPVLEEQIRFFVDEVGVSAAGTVSIVCSATVHANYSSLLSLPKKWETQHASVAVHPMVFRGTDLTGTVFRTPNVKTCMNYLNFHFHQHESSKTDITLNENATAHYFYVGLHSGNKVWMKISAL